MSTGNDQKKLIKPIVYLGPDKSKTERVTKLIRPICKRDENGRKLVYPIAHLVRLKEDEPQAMSDSGSGNCARDCASRPDTRAPELPAINRCPGKPAQTQPPIVIPEDPEYRWDGKHLYYLDKEKGGYQELCNFRLRPLRKIVDFYKHQESQLRLEILVAFADGGKRMTIKASETSELAGKIKSRFPEAYMSPEASKAQARLNKHFATQMSGILTVPCFHDVGWAEVDGKYLFIHDGIDGSGKFICDTGKKLTIDRTLSAREACRQVMGMLGIASDPEKLLVPWLFMHLGVVHTLFSQAGHSPNFLLFIYGESGSLKTALAKVLFAMYEGDSQKIAASFKDTKAALEHKMGERNDGTLLIDDFHPANSKAEQGVMKETLGFIIRLYGDDIAKSRANVDLTLKNEFHHHGLACITGEYVAGSQSSQLRCLLVNVKQGDYDGEKLAYFQENPLVLSTHLFWFIRYVQKNFEGFRGYIAREFAGLRERAKMGFKAKRLIDAAACLALVTDLVLSYGKELGVISEEQQCELRGYWSSLVVSAIQKSEQSTKVTQPAIMYLMAINALMENRAISIAESKEEYCGGFQRFIGFYEEDTVFLRPEETYKAVVNYWHGLQHEFSTYMGSVHAELHKLAAIRVQKDGGDKISYVYRTSGIKFPGKDVARPRMLAIKVERMRQILQETE